jgi:hypothetical protein
MVEPRTAAVQVEIVGSRPVGTNLDKGLGRKRRKRPTAVQAAWLKRGLAQPGGKLPLFDEVGQHYDPRTVRACLDSLDKGWAAPWIGNPIKPDWLVCKLTEAGRSAVS